MLRIIAFVAILITVRAGASERDKVREESKGTHINTINLLRRQERASAVNGNENQSLSAEGLGDVEEFEEENDSDSGDIGDDKEDDSGLEGEGDDDYYQESTDEGGNESESIPDNFETEHLAGKSSGSSLSQLHDMINKADPELAAEEASKRNFEENDMIDGDIRLNEESAAELVDFYKRNPQYLSLDDNVTSASLPNTMDKRKVIGLKIRKWKMPINYRLRTGPINTRLVRQGIKIWQRETCIRFKRKSGLPRITFTGNRRGCWAHVGKQKSGNTVNLGKGCQSVGIVLHEIGHALGFYHEQSRPDRGKYVVIKKGNIQSGKKGNFLIRPSITYGTKYDYGSVMHYRDTSFAKKKGLKTIIAKQPYYERTMGQGNYLSFYDVKAANFHYCQKRCKGGLKWSKCKHDGYRDPKNCGRCKCPMGWTGKYCTHINSPKPLSTSCGNRYRSATWRYQSLQSPGYPTSRYTPAARCTWRIRAPVGKRVRLYFSGTFGIACHRVCKDFVEVRHKSFSVTGPRYGGEYG